MTLIECRQTGSAYINLHLIYVWPHDRQNFSSTGDLQREAKFIEITYDDVLAGRKLAMEKCGNAYGVSAPGAPDVLALVIESFNAIVGPWRFIYSVCESWRDLLGPLIWRFHSYIDLLRRFGISLLTSDAIATKLGADITLSHWRDWEISLARALYIPIVEVDATTLSEPAGLLNVFERLQFLQNQEHRVGFGRFKYRYFSVWLTVLLVTILGVTAAIIDSADLAIPHPIRVVPQDKGASPQRLRRMQDEVQHSYQTVAHKIAGEKV